MRDFAKIRLWIVAATVLGPSVANAQESISAELEPPGRGSSICDGEIFGRLGVEGQTFFSKPEQTSQFGHLNGSFLVEPGYSVALGDDTTFRSSFFFRFDRGDGARTHADVRELYIETFVHEWVLAAGVSKVFWGVVESRHLVDIINQTDSVEGLNGEDKLGQAMVRVGWDDETFGSVELFLLPLFRARTFAGPGGRLRSPLVISDDDLELESSLGRGHVDLAARWARSFGDLEGALSYFYGHAREPELTPAVNESGPYLKQRYSLIHQAGIEAQWTEGAWLFKLESILRAGQGAAFFAVSGGWEYTWSQMLGSNLDLGFIVEGHYDGRDNATFNIHDHDAFAGLRIAFNDEQSTEVLAGTLVDPVSGATFTSVEAARRLGDQFRISAEAGFITSSDDSDPLHALRNQDFVELTLEFFL
jgi:hypothetical protein